MRPPELPFIHVRNLQRSIPVKVARLEEFARRALAVCLHANASRRTELRKLGEVWVLLISDRRMANLHARYLGEKGPTDIITFEHGEIFISVPTAKANARRFHNSLLQELELYIVHGLLHLHGFDDRSDRSAYRMGVTQKRILQRVARSES